MAEGWVLFAWLLVTTALIRASGPVALGGRELPSRAMEVIALLAPALLAALVVTETFRAEGDSTDLVLDERAIGLAAAAIALTFRAGFLITILAAMGATAGARAVL